MHRSINSYFGILAVMVVGLGAAFIIFHVANTSSFDGRDGTDPLSKISNLNVGAPAVKAP